MTNSKLSEALSKLGTMPSPDDGWDRLGILRNPFPTKSAPIWDVFHNQAAVRDRFYLDLIEFLKPPHPVTTLFFTGGNRVGKTHFMEHHRQALPAELQSRQLALPIAVVSAELARFEDFYFRVIDQISESLRVQTGSGLFDRIDVDPAALKPGDFRRAIEKLVRTEGVDADAIRALFIGWIRGDRLRVTQRRELGVYGLVDSAAQMQNTFGGIVRHLRACKFGSGEEPLNCAGLLIFVDEFELVWRHRRDRRDQFLQGLRALVDECADGGLFLCIGMATGLGPEVAHLEGDYPALFARLKGDRDIPALVEIESGLIGVEYVREFEKHARAAFAAKYPGRSVESFPPLFTDREVDGIFRDMVGSARGATVSQADFFDRLHLVAEERRKQRAFAGGAR